LAQHCTFCGIQIDPGAAKIAADRFASVNAAISEARGMLDTEDVPLRAALLLYTLVGPIKVIGWWRRYRGLRSEDPEFLSAKREVARIAWMSGLGVFVSLVAIVAIVRWAL
jgi:hypothetical protein